MREQTEINAEIAKLKEMKPRVRRTSIFGDDNHASIDAQVYVLENDVDEDDINDKYGEDEKLNSEAYDALQWKLGDSDDVPSEDWSVLTGKA